eukprot:CAMPEP_0194025944 /NCGR_PEP_ID=MMETSP0009_2-20130614/239_1 /TAXON_ID=210454 /ORGANISM="Grammatophora oceanica, Strain CCMP 410" /LENGTH=392 /DNA_ID=CAMNT_0038664357 /DNA_START=141 /DNA_END=1316 /DNA_ORIENTATION=+
MAFPLFGKPVNTVVTEQTIWMEIDFDFFEIAFGLVVAWGFFILLELDLIRRKISPQVVQGDDVMAIGESAKAAPVKAAKAQTKAAAKDRSIGAGANPTKWIMDTAGDAMGSVGRAIDGLNMKPKPPAVAVQKSKPSGKKTRALPNTTSVTKISDAFPKAMTNAELVAKASSVLAKYGYGDTTLLATSLCCDEVNRELEKDFGKSYGEHFSMGGLAGFAMGGVTSFGAMAHHIPETGSCLIIYGPHVGVDADGVVGKINRRGRSKAGACCGSAAAAAGYVSGVRDGSIEESPPPAEVLDAQQTFVGNLLLPHADRLAKAEDSNVELPLALFDAQNDLMQKIVQAGCGEVHGDGKIALLGGIQINTPSGTSDYFLPLRFELRDNKGELVDDLMW